MFRRELLLSKSGVLCSQGQQWNEEMRWCQYLEYLMKQVQPAPFLVGKPKVGIALPLQLGNMQTFISNLKIDELYDALIAHE